MMQDRIDLTVTANITIRDAMQRLDRTAEKCLFVVDGSAALIGALTDGDVRRAILAGTSLDQPIDGCFNIEPIALERSDNDSEKSLHDRARELLPRHKVEVIPVVDRARHIVSCLTWTELFGDSVGEQKASLAAPVVIMAGGYGTRLEPFTKVLPKPLIPVHDKPIIEHIIDRFVQVGCDDFWLTVNYKSRIMKAYFHDRDPEYSIHFVEEPQPLGTAGSLRLVQPTFQSPFFVTNCDIIVDTNYRRVMEFHVGHGHALTLVGSAVHYQIPYGTCVLNDSGSLARINEKPRYDFLVNTGMYVVNPEVLELIPKSRVFHMTHLMEAVISQGLTVGVFPVSEGAWIDVGQWHEYKRAAERL